MAEGMNGALLALGVVGAVALAGRVRRGSFSRSALLQQVEDLYELSDSDEEVDSGQLTYVFYNASGSDEVPVPLRHEADEILARSEQEGYIDTGEALELLGRIRDALRNAKGRGGSRAIYGMPPSTAGAVLRLGGPDLLDRGHAGEALNDYRWHPQRALAQLAASKKRDGSRATAPDLEKVMRDAIRRVTGREPYDVRVRSPEGAERWTDQPVPEDAVLFVIHDGGDLSLYGDQAPRRQVQKALERHGYRLMEDSHVYSFVVPI